MSLMDLLEETDRQTGVVGSRYTVGDDLQTYEDEEEDGKEDGGGSGGVEHACCVCMVRHKGAAFIPCGHTFCRLCSRELWVQRGNCPLCNGFILEILDIF
uniref:RING-type domain-containing protein n=1 Tax=Rhizophora mucronata TaxID=61149 RepID=A0A2P2Q9D6_RHIMU